MVEIHVTIAPNADTTIETISILEDLWHDYLFFRDSAAVAPDLHTRKRFERAAFLSLMAYAEGVVNEWLSKRTPAHRWPSVERKRADEKVTLLMKHAPGVVGQPVRKATRNLRNSLVHLDPSRNAKIYREVSPDLLAKSESTLLSWIAKMEVALGVERHPDTRKIGRDLADKLGGARFEGYSGDR
jgi:hypothetical protein